MAELMAGRAICLRTAPLVAITTKIHSSRDFLLQHFTRFYWPMTFGTLQSRLDMRRVTEEY